jgi:hypothetical protein
VHFAATLWVDPGPENLPSLKLSDGAADLVTAECLLEPIPADAKAHGDDGNRPVPVAALPHELSVPGELGAGDR